MPPARRCSIELSNASWLKASSTSTRSPRERKPLLAEPDLVEAVAALDLGGRDGVGQDVIAGAGGGLSHHLTGDEDAFAGFTGDADDEVFTCHVRELPPAIGRRWSAQVRATPEYLAKAAPVSRDGRDQAGRAVLREAGPTDSPPSDTAERVQVVEKQQSGLGTGLSHAKRRRCVINRGYVSY